MPKYSNEVIKHHLEENGWQFVEEILSTETTDRKIICICPNGHTSDRPINKIIHRLGCIKCILVTTELCHALAKEKGFKFLSEKYIPGNKTKYLWQCSELHQWEAKYNDVKGGTGCMQCFKISFNKYVKLIGDKGGRILTEEKDYINTKSKIKYVCMHNHESETTGNSLLKGHYCGKCSTSTGKERVERY